MPKRIFSFIIIGALALSLTACHERKEEIANPSKPYIADENAIDYKEESEKEPMTLEDAKEYLASEDADPKTPEYRRAVLAVNSNTAHLTIKEAAETKEITEEVQELFEGVAFRFIEGEQFGSAAVQNYLIKLGTYELKEDGYYHFTFYDRTLPQNAASMDGNSHPFDAYIEVIDLLLSDPNIEVLVQ